MNNTPNFVDSTTLEEPLEWSESAQKALKLVDSRTFGTGVLYFTYQPAQSWHSWRVRGR